MSTTDEDVTSPDGRFSRRDFIGSGAYKDVYTAFDNELGMEVAWNELRPLNPELRAKVEQEIDNLRSFHHPNIINLIDVWKQEEEMRVGSKIHKRMRITFATELMTSGTLKDFVSRTRTIKIKIIRNWCLQILEGLKYLHSREPIVVHRDLKCENIFMNGSRGELKIGDLGFSTALKNQYAVSCIGTPEFMAPEVYEANYNEKVDIYAFGMCVLEMVTGQLPYRELHAPAQILRHVLEGRPPAVIAKIPFEDVRRFILRCIAKDPASRPSAAELIDDPFLRDDPDDTRGLTYAKILADTETPAAEPADPQPELSPTTERAPTTDRTPTTDSNPEESVAEDAPSAERGSSSPDRAPAMHTAPALIPTGPAASAVPAIRDTTDGTLPPDEATPDKSAEKAPVDHLTPLPVAEGQLSSQPRAHSVTIVDTRDGGDELQLELILFSGEDKYKKVEFPFDRKADRPHDVASEMVTKLGIGGVDVIQNISATIHAQLASLESAALPASVPTPVVCADSHGPHRTVVDGTTETELPGIQQQVPSDDTHSIHSLPDEALPGREEAPDFDAMDHPSRPATANGAMDPLAERHLTSSRSADAIGPESVVALALSDESVIQELVEHSPLSAEKTQAERRSSFDDIVGSAHGGEQSGGPSSGVLPVRVSSSDLEALQGPLTSPARRSAHMTPENLFRGADALEEVLVGPTDVGEETRDEMLERHRHELEELTRRQTEEVERWRRRHGSGDQEQSMPHGQGSELPPARSDSDPSGRFQTSASTSSLYDVPKKKQRGSEPGQRRKKGSKSKASKRSTDGSRKADGEKLPVGERGRMRVVERPPVPSGQRETEHGARDDTSSLDSVESRRRHGDEPSRDLPSSDALLGGDEEGGSSGDWRQGEGRELDGEHTGRTRERARDRESGSRGTSKRPKESASDRERSETGRHGERSRPRSRQSKELKPDRDDGRSSLDRDRTRGGQPRSDVARANGNGEKLPDDDARERSSDRERSSRTEVLKPSGERPSRPSLDGYRSSGEKIPRSVTDGYKSSGEKTTRGAARDQGRERGEREKRAQKGADLPSGEPGYIDAVMRQNIESFHMDGSSTDGGTAAVPAFTPPSSATEDSAERRV